MDSFCTTFVTRQKKHLFSFHSQENHLNSTCIKTLTFSFFDLGDITQDRMTTYAQTRRTEGKPLLLILRELHVNRTFGKLLFQL